MIIIHVSVHMISRMEEYMIPYLMDKSLTRSKFIYKVRVRQKLLRATIAGWFLKSYAIIVLDLSKWETVGLMSKSITIIGKT